MSDSRNKDPIREYLDKSDEERQKHLDSLSSEQRSQLIGKMNAQLDKLNIISYSEAWKRDESMSPEEKAQFEQGLPHAINALNSAVNQINHQFGKVPAQKENAKPEQQEPSRKKSLFSIFAKTNSSSHRKRKLSAGRKSSLEPEEKKPDTPSNTNK